MTDDDKSERLVKDIAVAGSAAVEARRMMEEADVVIGATSQIRRMMKEVDLNGHGRGLFLI